MPLDPGIAAVIQKVKDANAKPRWEGTAQEGRDGYLAFTFGTRTPEQTVPVAKVDNIHIPGPAGAMQARVYTPEGSGSFPTVVYFHGGGWVIGDLDSHDNMCRAVCKGSQAVVVSVDYRLAPEHRFPAAVDDALAATQWVIANAAQLGGNNRIGIAGDSAGGNLSAAVTLLLRDTPQAHAIQAQFLIYPAVDHLGAGHASIEENATGYLLEKRSMEWFYDHYTDQKVDVTDPRLSPLQATSFAKLPPALIVTAEFDPLRDEGEAYGRALQAAGVPTTTTRYNGLVHAFFDMGRWSAGAQHAIDESTAQFGRMLRA